MAGSGSNRGGAIRSSGGTVSTKGPRFSSDALQRRTVRISNMGSRRSVSESNRWQSRPAGQSRYMQDKAFNSSRKREDQTRRTQDRARAFMADYGSGLRFPTRPQLRTRDSAAFNSKPGGRRPRTSRASLTNRRMAMSQDAWNRARG